MKNISEKIEDIFKKQFCCHPSRLDDLQTREAIRLLAKEIDKLIKLEQPKEQK
jgi:hypothetical protein